MPTQIQDADKALKKIKKAIREGGDEMVVLNKIDKALSEAGLPHVDPLYGVDPEYARVFLIYMVIAGKDWFAKHVGEIEDILDLDEDELDHPEN